LGASGIGNADTLRARQTITAAGRKALAEP
jgi:hypothetical protein